MKAPSPLKLIEDTDTSEARFYYFRQNLAYRSSNCICEAGESNNLKYLSVILHWKKTDLKIT